MEYDNRIKLAGLTVLLCHYKDDRDTRDRILLTGLNHCFPRFSIPDSVKSALVKTEQDVRDLLNSKA